MLAPCCRCGISIDSNYPESLKINGFELLCINVCDDWRIFGAVLEYAEKTFISRITRLAPVLCISEV